jgi:hypothetical protein
MTFIGILIRTDEIIVRALARGVSNQHVIHGPGNVEEKEGGSHVVYVSADIARELAAALNRAVDEAEAS